ncbi:MAG: hypothetical protein AB2L12_07620 [Smithellaceae bacterium]
MDDKKHKITFKYVHPDNLRDLYANGIYGGVTPRGELYIHFYSERHPIPKKATHKIDDHGVLSTDGDVEIGGDVVRLVQSSVILDIGTAIALKDWLIEQINYAETILKKDPVNEKKS